MFSTFLFVAVLMPSVAPCISSKSDWLIRKVFDKVVTATSATILLCLLLLCVGGEHQNTKKGQDAGGGAKIKK